MQNFHQTASSSRILQNVSQHDLKKQLFLCNIKIKSNAKIVFCKVDSYEIDSKNVNISWDEYLRKQVFQSFIPHSRYGGY